MKTQTKNTFFSNADFSIVFINHCNNVAVIGKHITDYPVLNTDGTIIYDHPGEIPWYIRQKVRIAYECILAKN